MDLRGEGCRTSAGLGRGYLVILSAGRGSASWVSTRLQIHWLERILDGLGRYEFLIGRILLSFPPVNAKSGWS